MKKRNDDEINRNDAKSLDVFLTFICVVIILMICVWVCESKNDSGDTSLIRKTISSNDGFNDFVPIGDVNRVKIDAVTGFSVDSKTGHSDIVISNLEENDYPCFANVSLGDGSVLFESPILNPGDAVNNVEIPKQLERGIYKNALITYVFYDNAISRNIVSSCQFPIEIIVK